MNARKIITIDGLAGSGKTSIARELAKKLGFVHLNSGILYRVYGYLACESGIDIKNHNFIAGFLKANVVGLTLDSSGNQMLLLNGQEFSAQLQEPKVSEMTSKLAAIEEVRYSLTNIQRQAFFGNSLVAEGRDMGTVIFPDADLKFFIQASAQVRATRRIEQLLANEPNASMERLNTLKKQMEIEILERDRRDSERAVAPTIAAQDAQIVLNEGQTLTQVVENMYAACAAVLKF